MFFLKKQEADYEAKDHVFFAVLVFVLGLAFVGVTFAQRPATDIDPARHPNLADAQHHIAQAFDKIDAAQNANKDQLGDPRRRPSNFWIRPAAS
ncbi:MAG: hypothetical protein WBD87_06995 [Candidatus Acidiferrales bacterium]